MVSSEAEDVLEDAVHRHELLGCARITTLLRQDADHIPILVHGPPQAVAFFSDLHENRAQLLQVTKSALVSIELPRVLRPELPAPLANGFTRNDESAFGQKCLDVPEAQRESMVQPDLVTDDLSRESAALLALHRIVHQ